MQRKFLILFIKYAKRGDLIHCTPDKTKKQSAGAERNFFVIKKFCLKKKPAACSLRVWYLSFLINYNKLFPQ